MIVRVFIPKETEQDDGSDYDGSEHQFDAMPAVGQALRFTDFRKGDFTVEKAGFIQTEEGFRACVWLKDDSPVDIDSWIASMND